MHNFAHKKSKLVHIRRKKYIHTYMCTDFFGVRSNKKLLEFPARFSLCKALTPINHFNVDYGPGHLVGHPSKTPFKNHFFAIRHPILRAGHSKSMIVCNPL